MRLLLIHLSDLHFDSAGRNPVLYGAREVANAAIGHSDSADAVLVVITGDFIDKGDHEAFDSARVFLDDLKRFIKEFKQGLLFLGEVMVPGNHDLIRPVDDTAKFAHEQAIQLLRRAEALNEDSRHLKIVLAAQDHYFNFENSRTGRIADSTSSKLHWKQSFQFAQYGIEVLCVNSAAMAFDSQDERNLLVMLPETVSERKHTLMIVAIHHPFNWLTTTEERRVNRSLEPNSDVILSGHEHSGGAFVRHSDGTEETFYFMADSFGGEGIKHSGFSTILFDLDSHQRTTSTFVRTNNQYIPSKEMPWVPIRRAIGAANDGFIVTERFAETLDPGLPTAKEHNVKMDEVYVYPRLRDVTLEVKRKAERPSPIKSPSPKTVSSTENRPKGVKMPASEINVDPIVNSLTIADNLASDARILIVGDHRIGKTALMHRFFLRLRQRGFVPILLSGKDLTGANRDNIGKKITQRVAEQYGTKSVESFIKLPHGKRAIIVDDFEQIGGHLSDHAKLLNILKSNSGITVISGEESMILRQVIAAIDAPELLEFRFYRIQPLDTRQQREMAMKIHNVFGEADPNAEDRGALVAIEKQLESVLGEGIVRAFPGEVKGILRDLIKQQHQGAEFGAYGFYYDRMIKNDLAIGIGQGPKDVSEPLLDVVQSFLADLAFDMYKKRELTGSASVETEEHFLMVHAEFSSKRYEIPKHRLIEVLRAADLVIKRDDVYIFREGYQRYYFLASKLKEMLVGDATREIARAILLDMTATLHGLESAEVVLFTIYLTNDPWLMDKVQERAGEMLSDLDACDLESSIGFAYQRDDAGHARISLQRLGEKIDKMEEVLLWSDVDEDEGIETQALDERSNDLEREERLNSTIKRMSEAFNMINIIGQAVRNYPAKIDKQRREKLVLETYMLGLRAFSEFNCLVRDERDELHALASRYLKVSSKRPVDDFRANVNYMTSQLVGMCGYGVVRRVTDAVASPHIQDVLLKVGDGSDSVGVRMIRTSVLLDLRVFSATEVKRVFDELRQNPIAQSILQNIVANHLRNYRAIEQRRVNLANAVNIAPENPRFYTSPNKPSSIGR